MPVKRKRGKSRSSYFCHIHGVLWLKCDGECKAYQTTLSARKGPKEAR